MNQFVTTRLALRKFAMLLRNRLTAAMSFTMAEPLERGGRGVGETVRCRLPINPTVTTLAKGGTLTYQSVQEEHVDLSLEFHENVPMEVSSWDMARNLEDLTTQVLLPAATNLAQAVDAKIMAKLNGIPNFVGTAGTPPGTLANWTAVRKALNLQKVPMDGRFGILSPGADDAALKLSTFSDADKRGSGAALASGEIGRVLGIDWKMSQNVATQGDGSHSTGWLVNEGTASKRAAGVTSIAVDTGTNNPEVGDVFTIAGDSVQHVVEGYASNVLTFSPGLGSAVADNAAITFVAQHEINFAGHPLCLGLTFADLKPLGGGVESESFQDPSGIVIRYSRGASMTEMSDLLNLDILFGARVIRPELGLRILG